MEGIWKVTDIDSKYEVSNLGRIRHRLIKGPNGELRYTVTRAKGLPVKYGYYWRARSRSGDR
ncbi:hypothetical protein [Companilactobacillus jidongensis]|uniref:hypothetical protein n=1 Tax=Companilactobacillus jidongensis TaxID=2486006 RepID=UPI000F771077|nr:hypothetical protein [Companilactobacillus jidongensis]